jgi:hypothetical protein
MARRGGMRVGNGIGRDGTGIGKISEGQGEGTGMERGNENDCMDRSLILSD